MAPSPEQQPPRVLSYIGEPDDWFTITGPGDDGRYVITFPSRAVSTEVLRHAWHKSILTAAIVVTAPLLLFTPFYNRVLAIIPMPFLAIVGICPLLVLFGLVLFYDEARRRRAVHQICEYSTVIAVDRSNFRVQAESELSPEVSIPTPRAESIVLNWSLNIVPIPLHERMEDGSSSHLVLTRYVAVRGRNTTHYLLPVLSRLEGRHVVRTLQRILNAVRSSPQTNRAAT